MKCPRCGAAITPGDRFCEECGVRLAAPEPPASGGREETIGPRLAGRTDPGLKHSINQDAFALSGSPAGDDGTIVVVCDGVSNSQTPDLAAATAARVAHAALAAAGQDCDRSGAMRDAIRNAHAAVCALPFDRQAELDPPATTIVAAWLDAAGATLGWLGDSRAYLIGCDDARLLTRDHSWMELVLERGDLTEAQARRDPRAHALLHCLGTTDFATASECPEPSIAVVTRQPGWLLLCTDGLWNYAPSAAALGSAAGEGLNGDAADLCARLVSFARECGGHDNITAVANCWERS